jgi:exopolysaccharide biosynthesis polyprenyl glycosylphosphotransferase
MVVLIGSFSLILLIELFDYRTISSTLILKFSLLNILVLSLQKVIGRTILKYFRSKGFNTRLILIIADDSTIPFINQILSTGEWGYKIRGVISNSNKVREKFKNNFPIYSEQDDYAKIIDEVIIDEVFFCKQKFETQNIEKFIAQSREIGVIFHIHNNVLNFSGLKPNLSYLNHQFLLSFRNTPGNYLALKVKGTIDFFLTLIILISIFPFMLIIGLIIKLDDGGPVFFKQVRVGRHGRLFKLLKFRTMVIDAEKLQKDIMQLNEQDGPVFKIKDDPRITKVGKFLRKTSLDELPQFINVLLGDMSIVGPRPPIPAEVKQYKRSINRRLSVNPGITCIWQVSGRNNIPFEQWMEMDMEYIDNWSLSLDFIIILKTFKVLFIGDGQ